MALSMDDKLLGEKTHYYCSSSEDEGEEEDEDGYGDERPTTQKSAEPTFIPEPEIGAYKGTSTNTGPKGVINDWRRFKQLETEKREEQEREKSQLAKKLTLTCRTQADDDAEKQADADFLEKLSEIDDDFIKEYRERRIEEMRKTLSNNPTFGKVYDMTKEQYIESIDKERPSVTVVVHVYENHISACNAMNGCLKCLAREFPTVKFCRITATEAKLSCKFMENGVPALLIYKAGELIGNFIRISDDLGEDFFAMDVESFLVEHGMLPDKKTTASAIRESAVAENDSDDSDFEVD